MIELTRAVLFLGLILSLSAEAIELGSDLYGEINVSYDWQGSNQTPDNNDWQNYVSRLGIKGNYSLSDTLYIVYTLEQEVDPIHGGTEQDTLFSTRNTYIGVSGKYGMVFFGAHDTPFKRLSSKVDLFNDQAGDAKKILNGEVRAKDSYSYNSSKYRGWQFKVMYIPSDNNFDSSQSFSLTHVHKDLYLGFSADVDVRKNDKTVSKTKVYDSYRAAVQYTPGQWKFGLLMQSAEQKNLANAQTESAFVANVSYTRGALTLMAQQGNSDILALDAKSSHVGVHYNFDKKTKVYLYYWDFDQGSVSNTTPNTRRHTLSLGLEHKF